MASFVLSLSGLYIIVLLVFSPCFFTLFLEAQDTSWENRIVSKLMDVLISNEGQGITAIYKIHLHFPTIISKYGLPISSSLS